MNIFNEYNINFIVFLHAIITIFYIILPFLPLNIILKYHLHLFIIIPPFLWMIFDGCPLERFENPDDNKKHINDYIVNKIGITKKKFYFLIVFYMVLSLCIIIERIIGV
jgi:hypothetical protein